MATFRIQLAVTGFLYCKMLSRFFKCIISYFDWYAAIKEFIYRLPFSNKAIGYISGLQMISQTVDLQCIKLSLV